MLFQSITLTDRLSLWTQEMKYLVPALAIFLSIVIAKYPLYAIKKISTIKNIVVHLLNVQMRMEHSALQIAGIVFEKIGNEFDSDQFISATLREIFNRLHFYIKNTESKIIPAQIMKTIHTFFSTYMVRHGSRHLVWICDCIQ
jgi:hypothetical protein